MTVRILEGDCRDSMRALIAAGTKVQTIITSPPYFGLRDYGHDGQIGLEASPAEFIAQLVDVFAVARELLADDGVMFLNMGDSYWSGGAQRAGACDSADKAPAGSPARDCLCGSLCDACRRAYRIGRTRTDPARDPMQAVSPFATSRGHTESAPDRPPTSGSCSPAGRTSAASSDRAHSAALEDERPHAALASTTLQSSSRPQAACSPIETPAAGCQLCGCSLPHCALTSVHTEECNFCTSQRGSGFDTSGKDVSGSAYPYSASASLKPKDLIGIPWRLAFALQAAGWYLRQDIIWSKPNPMPESVTDRCTKAHEYLFLLSKSPRYYFDAKAIAEPVMLSTISRLSQNVENQAGSDRVPGKTNGPMRAVGRIAGNVNPPKGQLAYEAGDQRHRTKAGLLGYAERTRSARDSFKRDDSKRVGAIPGQSVGTHRPDRAESDYDLSTRNKRSVWTVATQPFSEAHFATFPPALIEPCILAGSRQGDIVLDPFGGAGTTGLVADRHGRSAILCELNPDYAAMARRRIYNDAPLFAEVA